MSTRKVRKGHGTTPATTPATSPFATRRWSIAISKTGVSPWDDRMGLWQGIRRVRRLMRHAPDYGVTSIEINGRPGDGWDVDWLVGYEELPELAALRNQEDRREHLALLEETAKEARGLGLGLYVWSHELYLPPGFTDLYPETAGVDYGACTSHPKLAAFLRAKYREFYRGVPSLAGIVLSLNESSHFCLLSDRGCQCDKCRDMSRAERVLRVLDPVLEVSKELGRELVLRTFQAAGIQDIWGHPELDVIREAYSRVPRDVTLMSKYCPLDFYGTIFPDEPLIGVFPNPHVVEFSLDREWSGRTFVPVLTPVDYQKRLRHARDRGCVGTVARVDFPFPEMEPEETFDHLNEFNIFAFGRLTLDPDADLDELWSEWGKKRFGAAGASAVVEALKLTELVTQRAFYTKGMPIVNYHNMLPSTDNAIWNLWSKALTKWNPAEKPLTEAMFHPDQSFFQELDADKEEGRRAAEKALAALEAAKGRIDPVEWMRLRHQLRKLRDAVILFGHLEQAFFRMFEVLPRVGNPESVVIRSTASVEAVDRMHRALRLALEMERTNGPGSWPVISPDRGVTVFEFVEELLGPAIAAATGQPVTPITYTAHPQAYLGSMSHPPTDNDVRMLWRRAMEAARSPLGSVTGPWPMEVPTGVSLRFGDESVVVRPRLGPELRLPVGLPVTGPSIQVGRHELTLRLRAGDVEVTAG